MPRIPERLDGPGWRIADRQTLDGHAFVLALKTYWWGRSRWGLWVNGHLLGLGRWFLRPRRIEVAGRGYQMEFRRRLAPLRRRIRVTRTHPTLDDPRWLRRLKG